jgi:hypothetical protein
MNERIRELAVRILPNEKEFHQGDPKEWGYFFTGEELEKLAELIVQECIEHLESSVAVPNIEHSRTKTKCIRSIKEHFGVEE